MFKGLFGTFSIQSAITVLRVMCVLPFLFACGKKVALDDVETECVLPGDQANTLIGKWSKTPVPLALEVSDFSSSEQSQIATAVATWNAFFTASQSIAIYTAPSSSAAGAARPSAATVCNTALISPTGFTGSVKLLKSTTWTQGSSTIALTTTCAPTAVTSGVYPAITAAVMEINFANFFTGTNPKPDLQSIVLHELGHMLGLRHSCEGNACTSSPDEYIEAVMYPALGFTGSIGRQKRALKTNDMGRANCLYQP